MNEADNFTSAGGLPDDIVAAPVAAGAACRPSSTVVWRRLPLIYAFGAAVAIALITPLPAAWSWFADTFGSVWKDCGMVFPVFTIVFAYTLYCCVLLFRRTLRPLHADRLQLAEYLAYFAGILGVVVQLVSLSHGKSDTVDSKSVLGALAPFKIGLVVWGFAITVRWAAEHIARFKTGNLTNED